MFTNFGSLKLAENIESIKKQKTFDSFSKFFIFLFLNIT